jgi:hypothetical protein
MPAVDRRGTTQEIWFQNSDRRRGLTAPRFRVHHGDIKAVRFQGQAISSPFSEYHSGSSFSPPTPHTSVEARQPCGICGERKALGVSKERVVSPDSRAGAEVVLFAFGAHSPGEQVHHMPSPLRTRCRVLTNEQDPADSDGQQKIMDVTFCT